MRLAILNLTAGGASGGHKKYLQNMLPLLAASPSIEAILCASPPAINAEGWLPCLPKITYSLCAPFSPFRHSPEPKLRAVLDNFRPDVLFVPIERYMNYQNLPVVIMLQNMAPLTAAKTGSGVKEWLVAQARKYETRVALSQSTAVIVPTEYVRGFLAEKLGLPTDKITTIHYGFNAAHSVPRAPAAMASFADHFIFTAGSLESYRGIEDLLRALPSVKERHPRIKLVVAGGARPATGGYQDGLRRLADRLNVAGDVKWLGNIPEIELSWCYANCSAFALTSRVESFCFVALEAMSHGCSVVSTDSSCLPEILNDAGLYYKAGDHLALSSALSNILSRSAVERAACREVALARAAEFSWQNAAAATLQVIISACNQLKTA